MRVRELLIAATGTAVMVATMTPATADTAKPGTSMTHMKTVVGLASALEGAGVLLYAQGGATSAVMGDSVASTKGQVVFHIPITGTKAGVQHVGSMLAFFNSASNTLVQLQNPVIDLSTGTMSAVIPQTSGSRRPILRISNAAALKPSVKTDRKAGLRVTTYSGAQLDFMPGVSVVLEDLLNLPKGTLSDDAAFATTDITLNTPIPTR